MDIIAYLRVLRRHVWLIVLCVVVGAGLGAASTVLESESATQKVVRYYRGDHTLLVSSDSADGVEPVFSNLDHVALLSTAGDVPDHFAASLGEDSRELVTHLTLVINT